MKKYIVGLIGLASIAHADWQFDWSRVLKGEPPIIQIAQPIIQKGSKIVADSVNLEHLVMPLIDAVKKNITDVQGGIGDISQILDKVKHVSLRAPSLTDMKGFESDLSTQMGYIHDFIGIILALIEKFAQTGVAAGAVTKALGEVLGDFGVDTKGIPQAIDEDTKLLEENTKTLPVHLQEATAFIHALENQVVTHVQSAFIS